MENGGVSVMYDELGLVVDYGVSRGQQCNMDEVSYFLTFCGQVMVTDDTCERWIFLLYGGFCEGNQGVSVMYDESGLVMDYGVSWSQQCNMDELRYF